MALPGCSKPSVDTDISVLRDITDTLIVQPTSMDLFALAGIDSGSLQSIHINCSTISDYGYNTAYSASLASTSLLFSNPYARAKDIKDFQGTVAVNIAAINIQQSTRQKSNIYSVVAKELKRLATLPAKEKLCLVYSDLAENSSIFSVYKPSDFELVKSKPDKVRQILEQVVKPGSLMGIRLYLIYKPKNTKDNELFGYMSEIYRKLFESAGAQVFVGANVPTDK